MTNFWNGAGVITRSNGVDTGSTLWHTNEVRGSGITSADHDEHDERMAQSIAAALAKNGENSATGNLNLGGNRYTNAAAGTAVTDLATVQQIQDGTCYDGGLAGGAANAYTITLSPAIAAYATGQLFKFQIDTSKANTGASTLNVNAKGVKNIKVRVSGVLADPLAYDMPDGHVCLVRYDGTQFVLLNPAEFSRRILVDYSSPAFTYTTVTENNLNNFTLPAGFLSNRRTLRFVSIGGFKNTKGTAGNLTIKAYLGATAILTHAAITIANLANWDQIMLEVLITNRGATNSQSVMGRLTHCAYSAANAAHGAGNMAGGSQAIYGAANTAAEDTTAALALKVTWQLDASDANFGGGHSMSFVELL